MPNSEDPREATPFEAPSRAEALGAPSAAGEALQNEVAEHIAWQQSELSSQLTLIGCLLSVLGFCSISIDALALLETVRQRADESLPRGGG